MANYKETQLARVPGQPVDITVDSFRTKNCTAAPSGSRRRVVRISAAGQRHRQFHQSGPSYASPHSARQRLERLLPGMSVVTNILTLSRPVASCHVNRMA
jgi:multidrug efflux pump subunit AcrA (membrane-fusion protein)